MTILHLEKMSVEEKISTIELIWEDLSKNATSIPSPAWHEALLLQREAALKKGEDSFEEWSAVKKELLAELT